MKNTNGFRSRFTECNIKGEKKVLLCPDGLVFDVKSEHCDYPAKVNCTGRPELRKKKNIVKVAWLQILKKELVYLNLQLYILKFDLFVSLYS